MMDLDLHIHSCYSKNHYGTKLFGPASISFPEGIVKTAIARGLKIIAVTDHDNVMGGIRTAEIVKRKYKGKLMVIRGSEVTSRDGHILAYNIQENIPKWLSMDETLEKIADAGGVAVAAHPFNIKYSINKSNANRLMKKFFAFEISNSYSMKNQETIEFVNKHKLSFTIGSDAHSLAEIGICRSTIKDVTSVDGVLKAIKNKKLTNIKTYSKNKIIRIIPRGIKAFSYWKLQQIKHLFNTDVFLPYLDNEGDRFLVQLKD